MVIVLLGRPQTHQFVYLRTPLAPALLTKDPAYGRVANLRTEDTPQMPLTPEEKSSQHNLVDHFLTLTLAVLFESGLQKVC